MFDLTFFRFVLGFLAILSISFASLFFIGRHIENKNNLAEAKKSMNVQKASAQTPTAKTQSKKAPCTMQGNKVC